MIFKIIRFDVISQIQNLISIPFSSLKELKEIPEIKMKIQKLGFYQLSVEHIYAMCSNSDIPNYTYWNVIAEFDNNDWWEPVGGAIFEATLKELNELGIPEHDDWVHEFAHKMTPPLLFLPEKFKKEWIPPSNEDIKKYFERLNKHKTKGN